jgi:hypothetical protein
VGNQSAGIAQSNLISTGTESANEKTTASLLPWGKGLAVAGKA